MQNVIDERKIIYIDSIKVQKAKLRVAAYARVSSESEEQLNSFSAQVNYYNNYISQREDWELVDVYADEGVTGVSTKKRTDFKRMISDCEQGKIDKIITKSISRFARNNIDAIETTRKLKFLGISVLFENENMDTETLSSEYLLALRATFAQQESINISQNVKKGISNRMASGTYISTNVPYGYRLIENLPQIYEKEAEIVKRIFKEYLNGLGTYSIAKLLNAEKIESPNNKEKWNRTAVIRILKNERYIGSMLFQKKYNMNEPPYNQKINNGELNKYYVANTHEAIINTNDFEKANNLLDKRIGEISEYEIIGRLLSRKIKCSSCKSTMRRKKTRNETYWVCRAFDNGKTSCGTRVSQSRMD